MKQLNNNDKSDSKEKSNHKDNSDGKAQARRKVKATVKDTVFRDLFKEPKYTLAMYKAIHPEDTDVTEADISDVTINNVMLNQIYNDCSFVVRNRRIIMVECQSTWSYNIIIRSLQYYAENLHRDIIDCRKNQYASKKLEIPEPEFYLIYVGERKEVPEWISLSEEFFKGKSEFIELRIKVLAGEGKDIISQYISFTKVFNEQVRKYGKDEKAIHETIRRCKENYILDEYLKGKEKEVVDIMMSLFDNDVILDAFEHSIREESFADGREEGREEGKRETVRILCDLGMTVDEIAKTVGRPESMVQEWLCQAVEQK